MKVLAGQGVSYGVHSVGPDGRDEQGEGDDVWPTPSREDRRWPDVADNRPAWPLLHLDLLLMFGVPGALWWASSLLRVWTSGPKRLGDEVSLCAVAATVPAVAVGWCLLRVSSPPSPPWLAIDAGVALAASGAAACLLGVVLVRTWRRAKRRA